MSQDPPRILTTHTGSLPRSHELVALLQRKAGGQSITTEELWQVAAPDLDRVVRRQLECGIDIGNDGEVARTGFSSDVPWRMSGFGGVAARKTSTDYKRFPLFAQSRLRAESAEGEFVNKSSPFNVQACQGEVRYDETRAELTADLDAFQSTLESLESKFTDTFVTAPSPGIISTTLLREESHPVYRTDEEYVLALADEMRAEYAGILDRGHILQIDAPDLAMERYIMFGDRPMKEFLERVELHIEAINRATVDFPSERLRLHVCWGNRDTPHHDDPELKELAHLIYRARVGAIALPLANPRHQHEWRYVKASPPPDGMKLIAGVIDSTTNYLEHPEVVRDRLLQVIDAMGDPGRVIAGVDCGFETWAGRVMVAEDVVWEKLSILSRGAAMASEAVGLACT
jgi:5-methyltetrahydropteroyltriglutamate--homocysteine methyltransferase